MRFPDEAAPPKLSLLSLPNNKKPNQEEEPRGMLTPPLGTSLSVPFRWEEAPGRPKPSTVTDEEPGPKGARSLDLPPRLLINEATSTTSNTASSPTTVLAGPSLGKVGWSSLSFRRIPSEIWGPKRDKPSILFGSTRWGSFRKVTNEAAWGSCSENLSSPSSLSSSSLSWPSVAAYKSSVGAAGNTKVKITRIRRRTSFISFSSDTSKRSQLWGSIYESFKQMVPWRRRH